MTDVQAAPSVPEFRIVVTRPNPRGPLGPYRLLLSVVFAFAVAGTRIWTGLSSGQADDGALVAAAVAGLFVWVLTTIISNILGSVATPPPSTATVTSTSDELNESTG